MSLGDVLARWMAETRTGTTAQFKTKAHWLARTADISISEFEPGRWLRDAAALGHLEVDWDDGQWWAAPQVITRLPATDGYAMLCGLRCEADERRLEVINLETHRREQNGAQNELPRPSAVFFQYDSVDDLADAATELGAAYSPCSALQLAESLPYQNIGAEAAPPTDDNRTLQYFDADATRWLEAAGYARPPGAYRFDAHGRKQYRWFENGQWFRADLPTCVFRSLSALGKSAMRWRRDSNGRSGELFVDWGAPLPPLHQRAAVLCSGLVPRFAGRAETAVYENVPKAVAERIASTLNQSLEPA